MGFEVCLVALSDLSGLKEAVASGRIDPELVCDLHDLIAELPDPKTHATDGGPFDSERAWMATWARTMAAASPGLGARRVDLDRRFDWLGWVLDDIEPGLSVSVKGEHTMPSPRTSDGVARSVQGFAFRYLSSAACRALAARLNSIEVAQVVERVRPAEMEHLYKFGSGQDPALIGSDFRAVRRLYADVVANGEAILVITD